MDLNNDGFQDILSGSYSRSAQPMAGLFQVFWGQENGEFQQAKALADAGGEPLVIPLGDDSKIIDAICTRPTAVDWDGDGDLDLVVGNFGGTFFVFEGKGDGVFLPTPQPILVGDMPLTIKGMHSDPFPVDWDRDGDLDLVSGSSQGGVQWAENDAGEGEFPRLKMFQVLIPAKNQIEFGQLTKVSDLVGPASSTRVWVDDVNSDGKLDLIVGDSVTLTSPSVGLTSEEYDEKLAEWQKKLEVASEKMSAAMANTEESPEDSDDDTDGVNNRSSGIGGWFRSLLGGGSSMSEQEKAQQEMSNLYQQRSEFMDSESTGFVWLYLQK